MQGNNIANQNFKYTSLLLDLNYFGILKNIGEKVNTTEQFGSLEMALWTRRVGKVEDSRGCQNN
jgi:hypothetical protein